MPPTPTILTSIPRTCKPTLLIAHIHRPSRQIKRVSTPTFASVFNTGVLVHPAIGEAFLDRHVGAVVRDLEGEETGGRGLGDAGVVGEVGVFVGGDGGSRVSCCLWGCG